MGADSETLYRSVNVPTQELQSVQQDRLVSRSRLIVSRYNIRLDEVRIITVDCLQKLKGNQTNTADPNIDLLVGCSCNPPCQESTYTPTVSLAKFPATSYYVATSSTSGV